jgi:hypothetical protein
MPGLHREKVVITGAYGQKSVASVATNSDRLPPNEKSRQIPVFFLTVRRHYVICARARNDTPVPLG